MMQQIRSHLGKSEPGMLRARRKRPLRVSSLEILLLLFLWLLYGVAINSSNLEAFNLQQIGVEAIVERHQFYLEGSEVPQLQPRGDLFERGGHKYAAKQPGQFMVGAVAYFFLRAAGLTYAENYLLTSAMVTFLTASLLTAAAGLFLFRTARDLLGDEPAPLWPLAIALSYGLGSTALAYSGIAYHDAIANAYLIFAFHLVFRVARERGRGARATALTVTGAGFFLGLAIATSMTAFLISAGIALYVLSLRRWRLVCFFLLGGALGLAPLLVYDAVNFGNPFLLPNVAGGFRDTFFHLDVKNFVGKLWFYASMLTLYSPVVLVGVAGLAFYPRRLRREKIIIFTALCLMLIYLCNIDSDGDCQYGPRYLLPLMPFACLGLIGFAHLTSKIARTSGMAGMAVICAISVLINLAGALGGAMYCTTGRYAFWAHLSAIWRGETGSYPLARWLLIPLLICGLLLTRAILTSHQQRRAETSPPG